MPRLRFGHAPAYIGTVDDPDMHAVERDLLVLHGCRSSAAVPIMFGGLAWGEMWATRRDDQTADVALIEPVVRALVVHCLYGGVPSDLSRSRAISAAARADTFA